MNRSQLATLLTQRLGGALSAAGRGLENAPSVLLRWVDCSASFRKPTPVEECIETFEHPPTPILANQPGSGMRGWRLIWVMQRGTSGAGPEKERRMDVGGTSQARANEPRIVRQTPGSANK